MPPRRLKVTDVNAHVKCTLCDGYLVDATAIIECLHAFCRTCIVRYLENSKYCPVCDVQVHKTRPLLSIRSDQTLQDVVYKVVPDLYQNEMQRRREFYTEHTEAASTLSDPEERGEGEPRFFSPKECVSLCLQLRPKDPKVEDPADIKDPTTRHLKCPAAFSVAHLKKFVHLKFSLPNTFAVDIFYDEHLLKDSFTLMDVAYIYSWKRAEPMKFFYTVRKLITRCATEPPLPPTAPTSAAEEEQPNVPEEEKSSAQSLALEVADVMEPEPMEVDSRADNKATPLGRVDAPPVSEPDCGASPPPSTSNDPMDVSESTAEETVDESAITMRTPPSSLRPLPEPTYNSVKVVSVPECSALLSPTNGFRLKFIHDPEKRVTKEMPPSRKSGRSKGSSGGRSSRHKSIPVRLARLAPYPPPPPPVASARLGTSQPQLTVGQLVPTLTPTFVTTLVSATSDGSATTPTSHNVSQAATLTAHSQQTLTTFCKIVATPATLPSVTVDGTAAMNDPSGSGDSVPPATTPAADARELPLCQMPKSTGSDVATTSSHQQVATPRTVGKSEKSFLPFSPSSEDLTQPNAVSCHSGSDLPRVETPNDVVTTTNAATTDSCRHASNARFVASAHEELAKDSSDIVTSTSCDHHHLIPQPVPDDATTTESGMTEVRRAKGKEEEVKNSAVPKSTGFAKNSTSTVLSAEYSDDDDDLGCQPDLVVDERKSEESGSEENGEDAALRKRIDAIASSKEEDEEADVVTDDTEADSGRASDMSCPARSCGEEDGAGSPATTTDVTMPAVVATSAPPSEEGPRPKTNSIDHVIKQLYLQHASSPKPVASPQRTTSCAPSSPKTTSTHKDDSGVLDLSTGCSRKPGEGGRGASSRPRPVANPPVLDLKHRQQNYLPAPLKQHTACPPAPKHPPSSLLLHQLTSQHHGSGGSILQAQLTGGSASKHHLHHPLHHLPYSIPVHGRTFVSSPSSTTSSPTPPSYSYKFSPSAAHQAFPSSVLPYTASMMNMPGYGAVVSATGLTLPMRSPAHHQKETAPCIGSSNGKTMATPLFGCRATPKQCNSSNSSGRRLSDSPVGSSSCRIAALPTHSTLGGASHPRASPSTLRTTLSPHHKLASPAPSPQLVVSSSLCTNKVQHGKNGSKSEGTKTSSFGGRFKKGPNLAVFNPDPNGFRQKLVIKNLDSSRPSHNSSSSSHQGQ